VKCRGESGEKRVERREWREESGERRVERSENWKLGKLLTN
jgi:hypothetical protein